MAVSAELQQIIDNAKDFAGDAFSDAQGFLEDADRSAREEVEISAPDIEDAIDLPTDLSSNDVRIKLEEFDDFDGELDLPDGLPELAALIELYVPEFEDVSLDVPSIDTAGLFNQSAPAGFDTDQAPAAPDVGSEITTPTAPTLNAPNAPQLRQVSAPDAPQIVLPSFDEKDPDAPPTAPGDLRQIFDDAYSAARPEMRAFIDQTVDTWIEKVAPGNLDRLTALEDRVEAYLAGGSGLDTTVEQAIFDRARGRVHAENQATERAAWDSAAKRGFTLPPGQLVEVLNRNRADAANRNAQLALDVAIKQAELEQRNLQFAVQVASTLRTAVRDSALQYANTLSTINGQAIELASTVAQNAVQQYQIEVQAYQASLEFYTAKAQLFETRLRAALAEVEVFRTQVEVARLEGDLNDQQLRQFDSQVKAEAVKIQFYAEQMKAVSLEIEWRKGLIDVFRGQVQGYLAKVQAKDAEFRAYAAAIAGDEAKLRGQIAEIEGYKAELAARVAYNDAEVQKAQSVVSANKNIIEQFRSELDAYMAGIGVDEKKFNADLKVYLTKLDAFRDVIRNQVHDRAHEVESARLKFQAQRDIGNMQLQARTATGQIAADMIKMRVGTAMQAAKTHANIAGAAVSSQNTMVQLAEEVASGG